MPPAAPTPTPFRLHVDDAVLADLRERLARTRWPDQTPGEPWAHGSDLAYVQGLCDHWRTGFDWRAQEAALNAFHQYTVPLAGIDLHFIHEPGRGPAPLPLLLSHGWPGSVFEFRRLIPMLTDPARFGADPADAFTVVAPSLPGYTLSLEYEIAGRMLLAFEPSAALGQPVDGLVLSGTRTIVPSGTGHSCYQEPKPGLTHCRNSKNRALNLESNPESNSKERASDVENLVEARKSRLKTAAPNTKAGTSFRKAGCTAPDSLRTRRLPLDKNPGGER